MCEASLKHVHKQKLKPQKKHPYIPNIIIQGVWRIEQKDNEYFTAEAIEAREISTEYRAYNKILSFIINHYISLEKLRKMLRENVNQHFRDINKVNRLFLKCSAFIPKLLAKFSHCCFS